MLTATGRLSSYEGTGHVSSRPPSKFMHTASWAPRDVVDESDMRRGKVPRGLK